MDTYRELIDKSFMVALNAALGSFSDHDYRWEKRREKGLSDAELKEAIATEFGIMGGGSVQTDHYDFQEHKGGADPQFRAGKVGSMKHSRWIKGDELLSRVRLLKAIPYPKDTLIQGSLF